MISDLIENNILLKACFICIEASKYRLIGIANKPIGKASNVDILGGIKGVITVNNNIT